MSDDEYDEVYSVSPLHEWDTLSGEFYNLSGLFFQTTGGGPIGGYVLLTTVNPAETAGAVGYDAVFRVDKQNSDAPWVVEALPGGRIGFFYQPWGRLCVSIKTASG